MRSGRFDLSVNPLFHAPSLPSAADDLASVFCCARRYLIFHDVREFYDAAIGVKGRGSWVDRRAAHLALRSSGANAAARHRPGKWPESE